MVNDPFVGANRRVAPTVSHKKIDRFAEKDKKYKLKDQNSKAKKFPASPQLNANVRQEVDALPCASASYSSVQAAI
jgi:hypothetical protein